MMRLFSTAIFLIATLVSQCNLKSVVAWTTTSPTVVSSSRQISNIRLFQSSNTENSNSGEAVQSISVQGLYDTENMQELGQEMAISIQKWLDAEWMPQEIHAQMGQSSAQSLQKCQQEGVHDLMSIMMQVAQDLEQDWMERYDAEAFVGLWDVTNYVSDFLTKKSGIEGCECSSRIY